MPKAVYPRFFISGIIRQSPYCPRFFNKFSFYIVSAIICLDCLLSGNERSDCDWVSQSFLSKSADDLSKRS